MAEHTTGSTGVGAMSGGNKITSTITQLAPMQKIALGAAALSLAAGAYVLTSLGNDTQMAALYTDLEPSDASAVTDELIAQGVDYDLADGGRTVMVPRDDVYDLRNDLSAEGLPSSGEGYALLDEQGITTSEFRQRIDYQRALEGELSRTLRSIDGIEAATVHLALPEESVFVDDPDDPTASVLVRTSGTTPISNDQVAAMIHLVSSSIEGMTPENVTIADAKGAVLSAGGEATSAGGAGGSARTDATTQYENEIANSLRSMVGRVVGFENVAVTVNATLDLTERRETTESFKSGDEENGGVVAAERTSSETYSGADQDGQTSVLGPDGAPVDGDAAASSESTYEKEDAERTYAVDRTVAEITTVPGSVEELSVAVLVDESMVDDAQLAQIEAMVGTAAGIDLERGDQVTVTRLPFDTSANEAALVAAEEEAAADAAAERSSLIRTGVIALLVLVALLLAYFSTRKARREVSTPIDLAALKAADVDSAEPVELTAAPAAPAEPAPPALDPVAIASDSALEELSVLADKRPEDVAAILQNWLSDEKVPS